ncbi:hypothetical protein OS493_001141 [Desmophyllum pertusum]|uniref:Uncharacterized protein n=1 Tax=Desmophyllum pertusum TaxID=174260 RepID=A0A9W9ZU76_9CNID|nr:hypothetical protein OS493_001141 [Desmophyllum pertusum]
MFCSFCGESCVADAVFCHKCGKKISAGKKDDSPGSSGIQQTLAKAPEQLLSFAAFRSRKEEERAKHFKQSAKKFKTSPKKPEKEVKINIGVLAMKDGSNEKFVLKRYKEEIDKSYGRITLYLCSVDDYFDNLMYAMVSDDEELEKPVLETKPQHTFSGDSDDHLSACSDGKENESRKLLATDDASEQSYDIPGVATTPSNDETTHELTSQQQKKALVDQRATLSDRQHQPVILL